MATGGRAMMRAAALRLAALALLALFTVPPADPGSASARFCGRCGTAAVAGTKFCGDCGAPRGEPRADVPERFTLGLSGGVTMTFVRIPPGTFRMGSPEGEEGRWTNEGPAHEVTVTRPFWLAETECTQAQWRAVMDGNPSFHRGDMRPVEQVSWDDCEAFLATLNTRARAAKEFAALAGRDASFARYAFRLPTEAEWERACRAGNSTAFWWGERMDDRRAWHAGNSGLETRTAGTTPRNPFGLCDMAGNVWEWCADRMVPYPPRARRDPLGVRAGGGYRVIRGGGFDDEPRDCRSAVRFELEPALAFPHVGFRPAFAPRP